MAVTKKILLITSTNLFSNPRLVKEINLLSSLQYQLTVVSFIIGIGDEQSKTIEKKFPHVKFIHLSAQRKPLLKWLVISIINKLSHFFWSLFKSNLKITAYASNKRTIQLNHFLNTHKKEYNLIITHTLATLYPCHIFSKKNNIPFAFDMEDYHPGELIKEDVENEKVRRAYLLKEILPYCYYTSFASPLFQIELDNLLQHPLKNSISIYNGFPENEFSFLPTTNTEKINLIWYSLTIDKGRGLEEILPVIAKLSDKIHLTLVGHLNSNFDKTHHISNSKHITYLGYLPQTKLHEIICSCDIGLALEQQQTDLNRDLCLTNKIISYCQAGIYIFASNTKAQSGLINNFPELGIISADFNKDLNFIIDNIETIREKKKNRFKTGSKFSWETQQQKIQGIIKNV